MKRSSFLLGAAALVIGCGGVTIDPGQQTHGGAGSGGVASSSSSSGASSSSTSSSGTGNTGGTLFPSSSSGGMYACNDPNVFTDVVGDLTLHTDASCGPVGHRIFGSAGPMAPPPPEPPSPVPSGIEIHACSLGATPVLRINADGKLWPGTSMSVVVTVWNGTDSYGANIGDASLEVGTFEDEGGVITGQFKATVAAVNGPPLSISGKFRVCHDHDIYLA